jgi:DNA-binding transcriptional LysR family regulator
MGIEDIQVFVRVADALSFKDAARHLNISRSQASKRIAALEDEMGTTLIYRSPRSISLTSAGETLLAHYRRIFEMMEEARAAVDHLTDAPSGRLRLSMPTCLGTHLLPRLYDQFLPRHPRVLLDAHVSETAVDVVAGGYDVVVRIAQRLTDSTLTARRLATSPLVLAGAPEYLRAHGVPSNISELPQHRCLGLQGDKQGGTVWQFWAGSKRIGVPVNLSVTSDTHRSLVAAAVAGLGLIYAPQVVIDDELRHGTLQAVLPELCAGIQWGVYAVHAGRSPNKNAAALIDFVRSVLPACGGMTIHKPYAARRPNEEKNVGAFR